MLDMFFDEPPGNMIIQHTISTQELPQKPPAAQFANRLAISLKYARVRFLIHATLLNVLISITRRSFHRVCFWLQQVSVFVAAARRG